MITKVYCFFTACALLAGCASDSSDIPAQYVSDAQYFNYNCDQVSEESARVRSRVSLISGKQDDDATTDSIAMGVGLIIFWPALFILATTDDQKDELGRLKGEYEALQRVSTRKKCLVTNRVVTTKTNMEDPAAFQSRDKSVKKSARQRLEILDQLLKDGVISVEEAETKRQKILRDL